MSRVPKAQWRLAIAHRALGITGIINFRLCMTHVFLISKFLDIVIKDKMQLSIISERQYNENLKFCENCFCYAGANFSWRFYKHLTFNSHKIWKTASPGIHKDAYQISKLTLRWSQSYSTSKFGRILAFLHVQNFTRASRAHLTSDQAEFLHGNSPTTYQ